MADIDDDPTNADPLGDPLTNPALPDLPDVDPPTTQAPTPAPAPDPEPPLSNPHPASSTSVPPLTATQSQTTAPSTQQPVYSQLPNMSIFPNGFVTQPQMAHINKQYQTAQGFRQQAQAKLEEAGDDIYMMHGDTVWQNSTQWADTFDPTKSAHMEPSNGALDKRISELEGVLADPTSHYSIYKPRLAKWKTQLPFLREQYEKYRDLEDKAKERQLRAEAARSGTYDQAKLSALDKMYKDMTTGPTGSSSTRVPAYQGMFTDVDTYMGHALKAKQQAEQTFEQNFFFNVADPSAYMREHALLMKGALLPKGKLTTVDLPALGTGRPAKIEPIKIEPPPDPDNPPADPKVKNDASSLTPPKVKPLGDKDDASSDDDNVTDPQVYTPTMPAGFPALVTNKERETLIKVAESDRDTILGATGNQEIDYAGANLKLATAYQNAAGARLRMDMIRRGPDGNALNPDEAQAAAAGEHLHLTALSKMIQEAVYDPHPDYDPENALTPMNRAEGFFLRLKSVRQQKLFYEAYEMALNEMQENDEKPAVSPVEGSFFDPVKGDPNQTHFDAALARGRLNADATDQWVEFKSGGGPERAKQFAKQIVEYFAKMEQLEHLSPAMRSDHLLSGDMAEMIRFFQDFTVTQGRMMWSGLDEGLIAGGGTWAAGKAIEKGSGLIPHAGVKRFAHAAGQWLQVQAPAIGMGRMSYHTDSGPRLIELMAELKLPDSPFADGVNVHDPLHVEAALNHPEFMQLLRTTARNSSLAVATVDGLTASIGLKVHGSLMNKIKTPYLGGRLGVPAIGLIGTDFTMGATSEIGARYMSWLPQADESTPFITMERNKDGVLEMGGYLPKYSEDVFMEGLGGPVVGGAVRTAQYAAKYGLGKPFDFTATKLVEASQKAYDAKVGERIAAAEEAIGKEALEQEVGFASDRANPTGGVLKTEAVEEKPTEYGSTGHIDDGKGWVHRYHMFKSRANLVEVLLTRFGVDDDNVRQFTENFFEVVEKGLSEVKEGAFEDLKVVFTQNMPKGSEDVNQAFHAESKTLYLNTRTESDTASKGSGKATSAEKGTENFMGRRGTLASSLVHELGHFVELHLTPVKRKQLLGSFEKLTEDNDHAHFQFFLSSSMGQRVGVKLAEAQKELDQAKFTELFNAELADFNRRYEGSAGFKDALVSEWFSHLFATEIRADVKGLEGRGLRKSIATFITKWVGKYQPIINDYVTLRYSELSHPEAVKLIADFIDPVYRDAESSLAETINEATELEAAKQAAVDGVPVEEQVAEEVAEEVAEAEAELAEETGDTATPESETASKDTAERLAESSDTVSETRKMAAEDVEADLADGEAGNDAIYDKREDELSEIDPELADQYSDEVERVLKNKAGQQELGLDVGGQQQMDLGDTTRPVQPEEAEVTPQPDAEGQQVLKGMDRQDTFDFSEVEKNAETEEGQTPEAKEDAFDYWAIGVEAAMRRAAEETGNDAAAVVEALQSNKLLGVADALVQKLVNAKTATEVRLLMAQEYVGETISTGIVEALALAKDSVSVLTALIKGGLTYLKDGTLNTFAKGGAFVRDATKKQFMAFYGGAIERAKSRAEATEKTLTDQRLGRVAETEPDAIDKYNEQKAKDKEKKVKETKRAKQKRVREELAIRETAAKQYEAEQKVTSGKGTTKGAKNLPMDERGEIIDTATGKTKEELIEAIRQEVADLEASKPRKLLKETKQGSKPAALALERQHEAVSNAILARVKESGRSVFTKQETRLYEKTKNAAEQGRKNVAEFERKRDAKKANLKLKKDVTRAIGARKKALTTDAETHANRVAKAKEDAAKMAEPLDYRTYTSKDIAALKQLEAKRNAALKVWQRLYDSASNADNDKVAAIYDKAAKAFDKKYLAPIKALLEDVESKNNGVSYADLEALIPVRDAELAAYKKLEAEAARLAEEQEKAAEAYNKNRESAQKKADEAKLAEEAAAKADEEAAQNKAAAAKEKALKEAEDAQAKQIEAEEAAEEAIQEAQEATEAAEAKLFTDDKGQVSFLEPLKNADVEPKVDIDAEEMDVINDLANASDTQVELDFEAAEKKAEAAKKAEEAEKKQKAENAAAAQLVDEWAADATSTSQKQGLSKWLKKDILRWFEDHEITLTPSQKKLNKAELIKVLKGRAKDKVFAGESLDATIAEPETTPSDKVDTPTQNADLQVDEEADAESQEQTDLSHDAELDTKITEEDGPATIAIKKALAQQKAKQEAIDADKQKSVDAFMDAIDRKKIKKGVDIEYGEGTRKTIRRGQVVEIRDDGILLVKPYGHKTGKLIDLTVEVKPNKDSVLVYKPPTMEALVSHARSLELDAKAIVDGVSKEGLSRKEWIAARKKALEDAIMEQENTPKGKKRSTRHRRRVQKHQQSWQSLPYSREEAGKGKIYVRQHNVQKDRLGNIVYYEIRFYRDGKRISEAAGLEETGIVIPPHSARVPVDSRLARAARLREIQEEYEARNELKKDHVPIVDRKVFYDTRMAGALREDTTPRRTMEMYDRFGYKFVEGNVSLQAAKTMAKDMGIDPNQPHSKLINEVVNKAREIIDGGFEEATRQPVVLEVARPDKDTDKFYDVSFVSVVDELLVLSQTADKAVADDAVAALKKLSPIYTDEVIERRGSNMFAEVIKLAKENVIASRKIGEVLQSPQKGLDDIIHDGNRGLANIFYAMDADQRMGVRQKGRDLISSYFTGTYPIDQTYRVALAKYRNNPLQAIYSILVDSGYIGHSQRGANHAFVRDVLPKLGVENAYTDISPDLTQIEASQGNEYGQFARSYDIMLHSPAKIDRLDPHGVHRAKVEEVANKIRKEFPFLKKSIQVTEHDAVDPTHGVFALRLNTAYTSAEGVVWELDTIALPYDQRKQGIGTKVMRMLTEEAEKAGALIRLHPSVSLGTPLKVLGKFYRSHGFRKADARYSSMYNRTMVRYPKKPKNIQPIVEPEKVLEVLSQNVGQMDFHDLLHSPVKLADLPDVEIQRSDPNSFFGNIRAIATDKVVLYGPYPEGGGPFQQGGGKSREYGPLGKDPDGDQPKMTRAKDGTTTLTFAKKGKFEDVSRGRYAVFSREQDGSPSAEPVGRMVVTETKDGKFEILIDLEIDKKTRKSGLGKAAVMAALTQAKDSSLHISDIKKSAKGFWKKVGTTDFVGSPKYEGTSVGATYGKIDILHSPAKDQTETTAFREWSKGAPVAKIGEYFNFEPDRPVVVEGVHGTTHGFSKVDISSANPENDMGRGFYMSNTPKEVEALYASDKGPDLTARIEFMSEQLTSEIQFDPDAFGVDPNASIETIEATALKMAKEQLVGEGARTYKVYARMDKPLVIGGRFENETEFTYEYGEGTESGTLLDLVEAIHEVLSEADPQGVIGGITQADIEQVVADVMEAAQGDSIGAYDVIKAMKESKGLMYANDEEGRMASHDLVTRVFREMGFDGIIDKTVWERFGRRRGMQAMDRNTVHYIAFEPTQIKSAIGNRGTFDPKSENMLHSPAKDTPVYTGAMLSDTGGSGAALNFWRTVVKEPLLSKVYAHHMTMDFRPSAKVFKSTPLGKNVKLKVVGYASDGQVQALAVKPLGVKSSNKVAHITIATDGVTSPVHSNALLEKGYVKYNGPVLEAKVGYVDTQDTTRYGHPSSDVLHSPTKGQKEIKSVGDAMILPDGTAIEVEGSGEHYHAGAMKHWVNKNPKHPFALKVLDRLRERNAEYADKLPVLKDYKFIAKNAQALDVMYEAMKLGAARYVVGWKRVAYVETHNGEKLTKEQEDLVVLPAIMGERKVVQEVYPSPLNASTAGRPYTKVLYEPPRAADLLHSPTKILGTELDMQHLETTKARSMDTLDTIIAPERRFVGNHIEGVGVRRPSGKPFTNADIYDNKTFQVEYTEDMISQAMEKALDETSYKDIRQLAGQLGLKPPPLSHWQRTNNLPEASRHWYEVSAEVGPRSFPEHSKQGTLPLVYDVVAATSPRADPNYNMRLTLAILAEHQSVLPDYVPAMSAASVAEALSQKDLGGEARKIGSFSRTFQFLIGLTNKAPLSTNDRQVAASFGIDETAFNQHPVLYELISLFYINLRDAINEKHGKELMESDSGLFESYQLQALSWVEQRAEQRLRTGRYTEAEAYEGDSYDQAIRKAADLLREQGVDIAQLPDGTPLFTAQALDDPRITDILSPTTKVYRDAHKAYVTVNPDKLKSGQAAQEVVSQAKKLGVTKTIESYARIVNNAVNKISKRFTTPEEKAKVKEAKKKGKKYVPKKSPSVLSVLATAFADGNPEAKVRTGPNVDISRIDSGRTMNQGEVTRAMRVPLDQVPKRFVRGYLAVIGQALRLPSIDAVSFKVADPDAAPEVGHTRTHRVFIEGSFDAAQDKLGQNVMDRSPVIRDVMRDLEHSGHHGYLDMRNNGIVLEIAAREENGEFVGISEKAAKEIGELIRADLEGEQVNVTPMDYALTRVEKYGYEISQAKKRLLNESVQNIQEVTKDPAYRDKSNARDYVEGIEGREPAPPPNKVEAAATERTRAEFRRRNVHLDLAARILRDTSDEVNSQLNKWLTTPTKDKNGVEGPPVPIRDAMMMESRLEQERRDLNHDTLHSPALNPWDTDSDLFGHSELLHSPNLVLLPAALFVGRETFRQMQAEARYNMSAAKRVLLDDSMKFTGRLKLAFDHALGDPLRTKLQDRMLRVRRLQESVERLRKGILPEDEDTYVRAELLSGRTGAILKEYHHKYKKPLSKIVGLNQLSMDTLDRILWAMHARERNDAVRRLTQEYEIIDGPNRRVVEGRSALQDAVQAATRYQVEYTTTKGTQEKSRLFVTRKEAEAFADKKNNRGSKVAANATVSKDIKKGVRIKNLGSRVEDGSGMTDLEAQLYLRNISKDEKYDKYMEAAQLVWDMNRDALKQRFVAGLISKRSYKNMSEYKYYVPLMGYADGGSFYMGDADAHMEGVEMSSKDMATSRGISTLKWKEKRATGIASRTDPDTGERVQVEMFNHLAYSMATAAQAVVESEKNKAMQSFFKQVQSMHLDPSPEIQKMSKSLFEIIEMPTKTIEVNGKQRKMPDLDIFKDDNIIGVFVDGERLVMRIRDERGLGAAYQSRIARALKNLGAEKTDGWVNNLKRWTRFYSAMRTTFAPAFTVVNFIKDRGTALVSAAGVSSNKQLIAMVGKARAEEIARKARRDALNPKTILFSYLGLLNHVTGKEGTELFNRGMFGLLGGRWVGDRLRANKEVQRWTNKAESWDKSGGKVAFFGLDSPHVIAEDMHKLSREFETSKNPVRHFGRFLVYAKRWFEHVNEAIENMARLSVSEAVRVEATKDLISKHKGNKAALQADLKLLDSTRASISLNLTANFTRKGEWTAGMNFGWAFFNAGLQGSYQTLRMTTSPMARRMMYAITATGFANGLMNRMMSPEDEDGELLWDKKTPYDKWHNMLIMLPNGQSPSIPLPWGYNVFYGAGVAMSDWMFGNKNGLDSVVEGVTAGFQAFTPVAGHDLLDAVVPTLINELYSRPTRNIGWDGRNIKRERTIGDNENEPEWRFRKRNSNELLTIFSQKLNEWSGGNQFTKGAVDWNPDMMEHYLRFFTGGAGTEISKAGHLWTKLTTDGSAPLEARDIPIWRRFWRDDFYYQDIGQMYRLIERAEHAANIEKSPELLRMPTEEQKNLIANERPWLALHGYIKRDKVVESLRNIRKELDTIDALKITDAEKKKRADKVYTKRKRIITMFEKHAKKYGAQLGWWERNFGK